MIHRMEREDFARLIKSLAETPSKLTQLLQPLSPQQVRVKESDQFSALENICHLRDIEVEGYGERIKRILEEAEPSLPDIDGARLAIERDYNNDDLDSAFAAFSNARRKNVELVRSLEMDQLARKGNLEGAGLISLRALLEMMEEHDQGHLAELSMVSRRASSAAI
jgi:hypothetical protein